MFDKLEMNGDDMLKVMHAMHEAMVGIDGAIIKSNDAEFRVSGISLKKSEHFEISIGILLCLRYIYYPEDPDIEERIIRVLSIQRAKGGITPVDKVTVPQFLQLFSFDPKHQTQVNFNSDGGAVCMQKVSDEKFPKFKKLYDLNQAIKEQAAKN